MHDQPQLAGPQAGHTPPVEEGAPFGRPHADRASQFMPFAALRGYYDLILRQQRVSEPRRELTEEAIAAIAQVLAGLTRGTMVCVTHYDDGAYVTTEGLVSKVDAQRQLLTVVRRDISFDDIAEIEAVGGGLDP